MKERHYHLFFGMFGNRLRIEMVAALMRKPMGATALAKLLGAERSRVSHALLCMEKCRLVEPERKGKRRIYALNRDTVVPLLELVDRHASKYCRHCSAEKKGGDKNGE